MDLAPKPPEATVQSLPTCSKPRPPSSDHAPILSFTNGALKRHPPPRTLYRECLRNHAATLGRHALDGCGEFMPSPLSSPSNPTSLKCAACGCHRNFHRRDDDYAAAAEFTPTKRRHSHSPPPPPIASSSPYYPSAPQMLMALSAGLSGADADNIPTTPNATNLSSTGRKRFRTKFSKEQKESMHAFSEKLGWKMQKEDEKAVENFCNEIGVGKGVLKVWMHNNKHTFLKRDGDRERDGVIMAVNRNGTISNIDSATVNNNNNHHNISSSPHVMNGSSSSS